ncbi:hypothetical protein [Candidatus Williamhamiltonella defendens]|uniref:hypothetical protein n=1 Tax=Candidatus Williamhamiltonella defendens TaxID=138072 RepID=UPI001651626C|nr:hypothetical protein [Candidatus Hamiltonella defensa]
MSTSMATLKKQVHEFISNIDIICTHIRIHRHFFFSEQAAIRVVAIGGLAKQE